MDDFGFNPFDPTTQREPFGAYARGRNEFPVYAHEGFPVTSVFRYEDCLRILRDVETFSNTRTLPQQDPDQEPNMLGTDPPEHTRLRKLVNQAFTPRIVARLEPGLREVAHELLDESLERGQVDFVDALSYPLPVIAIAQILGVPPEERETFREWSDTLISSGGAPLLGRESTEEQASERKRVRREMFDYFTVMADERRREPRDDLISGLVAAELEGSRLTRGELLEMLLLLLVAGNETTTNLIGNAAIQLMAHRDALAELRANRSLLPGAIEEVLRFDSPVQADPRRVVDDVEVGGEKLRSESTVICWLGSANRDEDVFDRPQEFDIRREPNRHLAFGFGQHYCLGHNLARLEAQVAIDVLLERTSDFELANVEPLPLHPSFFFRGFRSIPMELHAP